MSQVPSVNRAAGHTARCHRFRLLTVQQVKVQDVAIVTENKRLCFGEVDFALLTLLTSQIFTPEVEYHSDLHIINKEEDQFGLASLNVYQSCIFFTSGPFATKLGVLMYCC